MLLVVKNSRTWSFMVIEFNSKLSDVDVTKLCPRCQAQKLRGMNFGSVGFCNLCVVLLCAV